MMVINGHVMDITMDKTDIYHTWVLWNCANALELCLFCMKPLDHALTYVHFQILLNQPAMFKLLQKNIKMP